MKNGITSTFRALAALLILVASPSIIEAQESSCSIARGNYSPSVGDMSSYINNSCPIVNVSGTDTDRIVDGSTVTWLRAGTYHLDFACSDGSCPSSSASVRVIAGGVNGGNIENQTISLCNEEVTVTVNGHTPNTIIQWESRRINATGDPIEGEDWAWLSGTNASSISYPLVDNQVSKQYRVFVSNGSSQDYSSGGKVIIDPGSDIPDFTVSIQENQNCSEGSNFTLRVDNPAPNVHYRWLDEEGVYKNTGNSTNTGYLPEGGTFTVKAFSHLPLPTHVNRSYLCSRDKAVAVPVSIPPNPVEIIMNEPTLHFTGTSYEVDPNNYPFDDITFLWTDDPETLTNTWPGETLTTTDFGNCIFLISKNTDGCYGTYVTVTIPDVDFKELPSALAKDQLNHITTYNFRKGISDDNPADDALELTSTSVAYLDGVGRNIQTVQKGYSPNGFDMVLPVRYDRYGRQVLSHLPFVSLTNDGSVSGQPFISQASFYNNASNVSQDSRPYATTTYENSPLNRPKSEFGPGSAWEEKPVTFQYLANGQSEVMLWHVSATGELSSIGYYGLGELYLTTTTDEEGHMIKEYRNKLDQVTLKEVEVDDETYAKTYYVYDDFDQLRYVLPPEATHEVENNPNHDLANVLSNYAFQYKYDGRRRLIEKKVPGADWVYLIYDQWDRLVLTQDGNRRGVAGTADDQYLFTKYDQLNRPIITGLVTINQNISTIRQNVTMEADRSETKDDGRDSGYTNDTYPTISPDQLLTVTYYDDYEFPFANEQDFGFVPELGLTASDVFSAVKGQVTGGMTQLLTEDRWLRSLNYYDDRYRLVQSISDDPRGEGFIRTTNRYDFIGNMLESQTTYTTQALTVKNSYSYDHANRLLKVVQAISSPARLTDVINANISEENTITKNGNGWNGGAATVQKLAPNQDGFISAKVVGSSGRMLGLSERNIDANYTSIDYAIHTQRNGSILAWEYPDNLGSYGNSSDYDELKVERKGATIFYLVNGQKVDSVTNASTGELIGDISINHHGGILTDVSFGFYTTLVENTYNELGELINKDLHVSLGAEGERQLLQSVDYRYNIRGWLKSINTSTLQEIPGINIEDPKPDLFGMDIIYHSTIQGIPTN